MGKADKSCATRPIGFEDPERVSDCLFSGTALIDFSSPSPSQAAYTQYVRKEASCARHWRLKVCSLPPTCINRLISTITRGIGLAVATALLETFNAIVVAIQRTRTPELLDLLKKHPSTLLLIDGDVYGENKFNYKSIFANFY